MEAIMQLVVGPEPDGRTLATRLDATIRAFRTSGATRIEVVQLGRSRVLVMAYRAASRREIEEEEAEEEDWSGPLASYFEDESALALVLEILERAEGVPVEEAEKRATTLAVGWARGWSPGKLRRVVAELASFVWILALPGWCEAAASRPFRVISAALEGLRLLPRLAAVPAES